MRFVEIERTLPPTQQQKKDKKDEMSTRLSHKAVSPTLGSILTLLSYDQDVDPGAPSKVPNRKLVEERTHMAFSRALSTPPCFFRPREGAGLFSMTDISTPDEGPWLSFGVVIDGKLYANFSR